jgi:ribonuclease-3
MEDKSGRRAERRSNESGEISPIKLAHLEGDIKHKHAETTLLVRALTRKAYFVEEKHRGVRCEYQNALCVLGDAILDAIVAEMLTKNGIEKKGEITIQRAQYVSRKALHKVAKSFNLHEIIRKGKGEQVDENQSRILADTLEALVGSIFLDSDYETTRDAVLDWPGFQNLMKD